MFWKPQLVLFSCKQKQVFYSNSYIFSNFKPVILLSSTIFLNLSVANKSTLFFILLVCNLKIIFSDFKMLSLNTYLFIEFIRLYELQIIDDFCTSKQCLEVS